MTRYDLTNDYFEWLSDFVHQDRGSKHVSFRKLLMHLHGTEFRYTMSRDKNRASDGIDLRWRFMDTRGDCYRLPRELEGPCSVLEMMIGLVLRCEETIMVDPSVGDRTSQWFWGMVRSLGLASMTDSRFDRRYVEDTIQKFLDRDYEPDGRGGLFTIRDCDQDLRNVEIWIQLLWYLDNIT